MRKLFIMLKRLPVIALATSIMFAPLVATAQTLDYYRHLAKAQLEKAHLKVVGPQTSSANEMRAVQIETEVVGASSLHAISKLEEISFAEGQETAAKHRLEKK
ncbi:hypothetical protein [Caulobacter sp. S45]|uniref:hypothetical protein n=1 Tax=Caulobacter sp. S45 TaxID=1641861 RepID=UPI00131CCD15|nr:hypothetical protein [Caulobacter sp. S45]